MTKRHARQRTKRSSSRTALVPSFRTPLLDVAYDMEDGTEAIEDFASAITYMCEAMDEGAVASSVQRLAQEIIRHVRKLEEQRVKIFDVAHSGPRTLEHAASAPSAGA